MFCVSFCLPAEVAFAINDDINNKTKINLTDETNNIKKRSNLEDLDECEFKIQKIS